MNHTDRNVFLIAIVVVLGGIVVGLDTAVISGMAHLLNL